MNDFTSFKSEDFLANESFVNYLMEKNNVDVNFWKNWIRDNPECENEVKEARLLFFIIKDQHNLSAKPEGLVQINKQYSDFRFLLQKGAFGEKNESKRVFYRTKSGNEIHYFRKKLWYITSVAAAFLMAVCVTIFLKYQNNTVTKNKPVFFVKTENNIKEVKLSDGSKVQLNNNSSVTIKKNFNSVEREVLLTGSAFFEVHKDASKPFVVTAGITKTTALGTSFYIHVRNNNSVTVSLLEGKVKVEENKHLLELVSGEKALSDSGKSIIKGSFDTKQLLFWRKGEMRFEHANWKEIKTFIEEYFNKEVQVKGKIPKFNFTGDFKSQKIETILNALSFTYNAKYKSDGQKVIITFQ